MDGAADIFDQFSKRAAEAGAEVLDNTEVEGIESRPLAGVNTAIGTVVGRYLIAQQMEPKDRWQNGLASKNANVAWLEPGG